MVTSHLHSGPTGTKRQAQPGPVDPPAAHSIHSTRSISSYFMKKKSKIPVLEKTQTSEDSCEDKTPNTTHRTALDAASNGIGVGVSAFVEQSDLPSLRDTQQARVQHYTDRHSPQQTPHLTSHRSKKTSQPPRCLRSVRIGNVVVSIVQCNLAQVKQTSVLVNAANSRSFTPMDAGVSGALRRASQPFPVSTLTSTIWQDSGQRWNHCEEIPSTHVGAQRARGGLALQNIIYVLHAVGPIWTDYSSHPSNQEALFRQVPRELKHTLARVFNTCARLSAATRESATNHRPVVSCAIPPISGGIFTHNQKGTNLRQREQWAARRTLVETTFQWCIAQWEYAHPPTDHSVHSTPQAQVQPSSPTAVNYDTDPNHVPIKKSATVLTQEIASVSILPCATLTRIDLCDLECRGLVRAFDELCEELLLQQAPTKWVAPISFD